MDYAEQPQLTDDPARLILSTFPDVLPVCLDAHDVGACVWRSAPPTKTACARLPMRCAK